MKKKRAFLYLLCCLVLIVGCGKINEEGTRGQSKDESVDVTVANAVEEVANAPKYVFLFIGDGMSYPQIQAAADYLGAVADPDYQNALPSVNVAQRRGAVLDGPIPLNFMSFEAAGSAVNYDACSFAPDSSSSATSIATGNKTYSGMLNVSPVGGEKYETIAEKLHAQKGWKVGVVTTVNLNHATPGAFYAHQMSRDFYYEIGVELTQSGFEYFAGGAFREENGQQGNLYDLAKSAGYKIADTQTEAEDITAEDEKIIIVAERVADQGAMYYEIDRQDDQWALEDYVKKGIEVLDNEEGFFMMCEGGKIDWACHANDAATVIHEVLALEAAVETAIDFAKQHPQETLILVTGDHETGGLAIGFAGTDYDTYLTHLTNQKISFMQFDEQYVAGYIKEQIPFEMAMKDVEELFGLKVEGEWKDKLVLTDYELELLEEAYNINVLQKVSSAYPQEQDVLYGEYSPFTVTITHILNNKSGIDFTSYSHTGLPVGVFASGVGASEFNGYYDNTEIFNKLTQLLSVE